VQTQDAAPREGERVEESRGRE